MPPPPNRGHLILSAAVLLATPARAETPAPTQELPTPGTRPGFFLNRWEAEAGLGAVITGLLITGNALGQGSRAGHAPDSGYAPYDQAADHASEVTGAVAGAVIGLALGSGLEALHLQQSDAAKDFWWSTMVATEAWLLSSSITFFVKRSAGRCRPLAWDELAERCDPDLPAVDPESAFFSGDTAYRAMPSGHVTGISGISGAYLWLAAASREQAPLRWIAFGVTQGMAWTTAALRVEAGVHSWTDTVAAWGIGMATGLGVAALHPRRTVVSNQPALHLVPRGAGLMLTGRF